MVLPISACIITLNEEDNLERCLSGLDFVDEIIVLDSGSTDRTLDIAKKFTKNVFFREFDNYANQKNHAIRIAKNEWILTLDADEEIGSQLREEILQLKEEDWKAFDGFFIPRLTYYLHTWIHHSGWYPDLQIRLFRKSRGEFQGGLVHETISMNSPARKLRSPVLHYSYRSISDHLQYIDRYTTLYAMEKFRKGKRSGMAKAFVKMFYKFWWSYIFRLGFLDGRAGFAVCTIGAYYNFLKYLKLYELERNKERET